jgi:hypothetical protein
LVHQSIDLEVSSHAFGIDVAAPSAIVEHLWSEKKE